MKHVLWHICRIAAGVVAFGTGAVLVVVLTGCAGGPRQETFAPTLPAHLEAEIFDHAAEGRELSELERLVVDAACQQGRAPAGACR